MKFPPTVWGPLFWATIHIVAIGYPKEPSYGDKRAAKEFFESLQFLLPCSVCREHYKKNLQIWPITPYLDRREDLFRWTVMLHNEVNKQTGKKIITEAEALAYLGRLGARGKNPIVSQADFEEMDMRSYVKGALTGAAVMLVAGTALWWVSKGER